MIKMRSTLNSELNTSIERVDVLDLHICKPSGFNEKGILTYRTHQKSGNKYQYLHRKSLHPPHTFKALIKGELVRCCLTNKNMQTVTKVAYVFAQRLLARGYQASEFLQVFRSLDYNAVRPSLLCGKPSHSVEPCEMESQEPRECQKHLKLQFNSTTYLLKCKPAITTAIQMSLKLIRECTNNDKFIDILSR
jgi:hypothetical protein